MLHHGQFTANWLINALYRATHQKYLDGGYDPWRWEGIYIIVYHDQQPHEIFFWGFSGD